MCAVMVDEWSAGRAGTVSFLLFLQSEEVNELPGKLWFVGDMRRPSKWCVAGL